ncbi:MAG: hypothetical protein H7A53_04055 [Akkermansiaceae bacterium]|nr:hypothetical protein [Akkermansiaceae bacterium]
MHERRRLGNLAMLTWKKTSKRWRIRFIASASDGLERFPRRKKWDGGRDDIHRWTGQHGTRALPDEIRASIPPLD